MAFRILQQMDSRVPYSKVVQLHAFTVCSMQYSHVRSTVLELSKGPGAVVALFRTHAFKQNSILNFHSAQNTAATCDLSSTESRPIQRIPLEMRRAAALTTLKPEHNHVNGAGPEEICILQERRRERRKRRHLAFVGNLALAFLVVSGLVLVICLCGVLLVGKKKRVSNLEKHNLRISNSIPDAGSNSRQQGEIPKLSVQEFERYTPGAPECTAMMAKDISYTLVTQLSMDRIWMMKHHCQRWGNTAPISVAVLTNQTLLQTRAAIIDMGCDDEILKVQTMKTTDELEKEYPVHRLRRIALSAVRTSHVMYVDIDFWESVDLHDILYQPSVREALAADPKRGLVVPAFQLNRQCREYRDCPEENIPKMPQTRKEMVDTVLERRGSPFDPTNRGGHGSTLYVQWMKQGPGDMMEIPCIQSNRYEPYLALRYCRDLPPFQVQFSGYGKNKMTWVMQLRREGYIFSQLGGAFVVHYPHLDSVSRMEWNQGPTDLQPIKGPDGKMYKKRPSDVKHADWASYKRGRVDAAFIAFRKWMLSEIDDTARVQMCEGRNDDDSRLWIDRSHAD